MSSDLQTQEATRVLMVSTSYPADSDDWRGVFIRNLAEALARRRDIELRLWSPPGDTPGNAVFVSTAGEQRWLKTLMENGGIAHLLRTRPARGLPGALRLLSMLKSVYRREQSASLIHVNWLQNALPLRRDKRPVLLTVLGTDMQLLALPGMATLLRRALAGRPVAICPNAEWMLRALQREFGSTAIIRHIPFGIQRRWFEVTRTLTTPPRWLCVSRLTQGKIGTLFDWCEPWFADGRRELHLFGPMQQTMSLPPWVHYHGAASPDVLCRQWFPTAQGLITLSQHAEGRPQVMLEAMAAGLPIIASAIPAHVDLLDEQTGFVCRDAQEVGRALEVLDAESTNRIMGDRARARMQAEVGTWDDCAARYASVYQELQGQRG